MEIKNVLLSIALIVWAIAVGEIAAKPNQMTSLDEQMTEKVKVDEKTSAKLDPMIEPASGAKVQVIQGDSTAEKEDEAKDSIKIMHTDSDYALSKILEDGSHNAVATTRQKIESDANNVKADEVNSVDVNDETEDQLDEAADEEREKRSSKMNNYRANFAYACPNGRSLSTLLSAFNPSLHDRQWTASCDKLLPSGYVGTRYWSTNYGYDNDHKTTLHALCPPQAIMTGLAGYWDQASRDRRYKLYCTHVWHHQKVSCKWSPYINNFKESAHFTLGCIGDYYVAGMVGYYHASYSDRRFRMYLCKLQKI